MTGCLFLQRYSLKKGLWIIAALTVLSTTFSSGTAGENPEGIMNLQNQYTICPVFTSDDPRALEEPGVDGMHYGE